MVTDNGKSNGSARREPYAEACERDDVARPTNQVEVWLAYKLSTGAFLGVAVANGATAAKQRAGVLYGEDMANVVVERRNK